MTFFVGPQKAGTTWIDSYLRWHGGVNLPEHIKETMFFDSSYDKGIDYYESIFSNTNLNARRVEVAPTYFANDQARKRIKDYAPNARVIISVREPASRTFSSYRHEQRYGFINKETSFRAAVEEHHLEEPSLYHKYYQQWVTDFGENNIEIVLLSEMIDLDAYAQHICTLLEIPFRPAPAFLHKKVNEGGVPRSHLLAGLASRANRVMRKLGLLSLRRKIVDSPLKELIYSGGQTEESKLSDQDRQWLMEHYLTDDWQSFQTVLEGNE